MKARRAFRLGRVVLGMSCAGGWVHALITRDHFRQVLGISAQHTWGRGYAERERWVGEIERSEVRTERGWTCCPRSACVIPSARTKTTLSRLAPTHTSLQMSCSKSLTWTRFLCIFIGRRISPRVLAWGGNSGGATECDMVGNPSSLYGIS